MRKASPLIDHLVLIGCSISFAPVTDVKIQLHVFITTAPPQYCYFGMLKSESGVTLLLPREAIFYYSISIAAHSNGTLSFCSVCAIHLALTALTITQE